MPLGIAAVEDLDVISMRWLLHPTPENTWRFIRTTWLAGFVVSIASHVLALAIT